MMLKDIDAAMGLVMIARDGVRKLPHGILLVYVESELDKLVQYLKKTSEEARPTADNLHIDLPEGWSIARTSSRVDGKLTIELSGPPDSETNIVVRKLDYPEQVVSFPCGEMVVKTDRLGYCSVTV